MYDPSFALTFILSLQEFGTRVYLPQRSVKASASGADQSEMRTFEWEFQAVNFQSLYCSVSLGFTKLTSLLVPLSWLQVRPAWTYLKLTGISSMYIMFLLQGTWSASAKVTPRIPPTPARLMAGLHYPAYPLSRRAFVSANSAKVR